MSKKEKAICQTCDKEFSYYRSTLRGLDAKYCSRDCIDFTPWNKGKIEHNECSGCGKTIRIFRKYCSQDCYRENKEPVKTFPDRSGENNPSWKGGKPKCKYCDCELSTYGSGNKYGVCRDHLWKEVSGENHWNWKGGPDTEALKIRKSRDYRIWREAVFKRDDYICQICGIRGGYLEADHIKPFSKYPELRLAIDNGRTLCKDCHLEHGWRIGR